MKPTLRVHLVFVAFVVLSICGCAQQTTQPSQSRWSTAQPAVIYRTRSTTIPAAPVSHERGVVADSPEPPLLSREEFDRETARDAASDPEEKERQEFRERGGPPDGGGERGRLDEPSEGAVLASSGTGRSRTHLRTRGDVESLRRTARSHHATDYQITLSNAFIERYKNRVTLDTTVQITGASGVHPIESNGKDGDIHMGSLSDEVGLPFVAEIMNAKDNPALPLIRQLAGSSESIRVAGAWRLWCEHPGAPQIQFELTENGGLPSNPDHVFEIHPVSRLGDIDETGTFHQIPGFEAYDANTAFTYYESIECRLVPDLQNQTTTIFTPKAKYNYCEFWMQVDEDQQFQTADGRIVRCSICDSPDGEPIFHNRRMVFVKNTRPEIAVRTMRKGDRLHVLGIPRIDLALVSWRTRAFHTRPEVLTWKLPYEIIVVGIYV